ncbi:MAG: sensor domain-containing diguanylate cyclase [Acidimicrobiales bacterium]|nr:sensor domain-containing diguanylate cyclase [Acidimicrobiales bacterium]
MGLDGESGPETSADATGPDGSTLWYAALGHLIDEVVFIHRADRTIAFVSPSVTEVLGYTPGEFTSMRTPELIHPEDLPMATEQALALRAEPGARYRSILRVRHADGRWLWVEIVGRNLLHEPSVQGIVQTLRDISERRRLEEELEHRAHHDGLTGLANRNHFLDQLDAALASDAERLAVLYLDLDGFKAVNDNHGHRCGDQVLRVVAERLASTSRPGDVCGRLGGDEFVAFFRDVDGREAAAAVGHRVHAAITGPAVLSDRTVEIRTSVGVAVPAPDEDADRVMSRADAALYTAKRAGGGVELA